MHGQMGDFEVYTPSGQDEPTYRSRGPWAYNELVRRTIVKFVDPERPIGLPLFEAWQRLVIRIPQIELRVGLRPDKEA